MKTFKDLYEFLQCYNGSIIDWLNQPWEGKDKQESLLRLFGGLGVIEKLNGYKVCKGNFNLKTIQEIDSVNDIFYRNNEEINLKDKGDSSDLTCIKNDRILAITSKNIEHLNIGKLDITQILAVGYDKLDIGICVRNAADLKKMIIEKTNDHLREIVESALVIDWSDLSRAYKHFKNIYSMEINNINKNPLCLKLHQEISVRKTLELKEKYNEILWGHIQRSGKSYIIAGTIAADKHNNYLVITTAPNETIEQYINVFNCLQLQDYNIINVRVNKRPKLSDKNIIICSKQFLHTKDKVKTVKWIKDINFDMRFIDEAHNGGTTKRAKTMLDIYGANSFTIQITATYNKPSHTIPRDAWILWDLEDIKMCKEGNVDYIKDKFNVDIDKDYIINEYSKYPDLTILTPDILDREDIKIDTEGTNYGWSTEACFLLKQEYKDGKVEYLEEFQDEEANIDLWYKIFGKRSKYNVPKRYSDDQIFIKRIESICTDSRNGYVIMAFLPPNNIEKISNATKKLLRNNNVIDKYDIISINSATNNNPKQVIERATIAAKRKGKKGLLVLSGRQCSLGVSIEDCDCVLLLNNTQSYDMMQQMMFRSMTEAPSKKYGFVVDMNIHRAVNMIIEYGYKFRPDLHPRESIEYIMKNKIISFNSDVNFIKYGRDRLKSTIDRIYEIYANNAEESIELLINRLNRSNIVITDEQQKFVNSMFSYKTTIPTKDIKKGIEKIEVDRKPSLNTKTDKPEKDINYMEILKHIMPLICILTIHSSELSFEQMYNDVFNDKDKYTIFIEQITSWWGKDLNIEALNMFKDIYLNNIKENKELIQIIGTVKELFVKNINNSKELSKLIDKYFIPQDLEKKTNAEVSTPHSLRQDMLDLIEKYGDKDFWRSKKLVFEPCSGKGGFIVDIISRFMDRLEIKDKDERYRTIVEECLYFCDINSTNIYICKLLLDPLGKYKLNYHCGNTLELDVKDKWGIDDFDAVVGNPPYNASGTVNTGNIIWNKFVEFSIKHLKKGGYLCYVHPAGWRKPETEKTKTYGFFDMMTKKSTIRYLSIHGTKDGMKVFKCNTRYDWYLLEKTETNDSTIISDEDNNLCELKLSEWDFLPNKNFDLVKSLIGSDKCKVIYSRSLYGSDRKNVSKVKTDVYKYPLIHSTPKKGVKYLYTDEDKGHFGVSKVIFGKTGIGYPVFDKTGEYGLTESAIGIETDTDITDILKSDKFTQFIKSCNWSHYQLEWRLFNHLKSEFWNEFI